MLYSHIIFLSLMPFLLFNTYFDDSFICVISFDIYNADFLLLPSCRFRQIFHAFLTMAGIQKLALIKTKALMLHRHDMLATPLYFY